MSIDPKFVELTADALKIFIQNVYHQPLDDARIHAPSASITTVNLYVSLTH